jgi:septum formation protein
MVKKTQNGRIILASQSPRRKYLLTQAGLEFDVLPSHIDENALPMDQPGPYTCALSRMKANEISVLHPDSWVIAADTIVVIENEILGKPDDLDQARHMLYRLSGQTHQVYTGYTICCDKNKKAITDSVCTDVIFKQLSDEEIEWYIHTGEPFDKAGAYAIQGLGTFLVKRINGSYTNVVGLPVCEVIEHLIRERVVRITPSRYQGQKMHNPVMNNDF